MMRLLALTAALLFGTMESVRAFCGFYVAQTGGALVNHASKVVLAREGERTSITMSSDVEGDPKQFALVIPVPTTIQREQVRLVASQTVDHLDAFSVPRLVEYFDPDPCPPPPDLTLRRRDAFPSAPIMAVPAPPRSATGVKIEAEYSVGEYDIQVLSAQNSGGLLVYLNSNGYKIPPAAEPTIRSYLGQRMQFFVAKVNLERQARQGNFLRPIQVEYRSPKFMLPIRLGTVNANGPQEMIVLALTRRGRVETTNYRTVQMPTGSEVPRFVQADFANFYKAAFDRRWAEAEGRAVVLEYAWNMANCDPCSAPALTQNELKELGATWPGYGAFVTRLHLRYDREHFPEDLALQETGDAESYQARYVVRQPWKGGTACPAGDTYRASLPARSLAQARTLLELTEWNFADVRDRMAADGQALP